VSANGPESDTAGPGEPNSQEAEIKASLASLSPEDRRLADEQRFCPVIANSRLGSMGTPVKVNVDGQPVFLCCAGCKAKALKNPKTTLDRVAQLKRKHVSESSK
jgi:hypothetical protein